MKTGMIQISSAQLAYALYGDGKVGIVIEMGLGASMAEWNQLAKRLSGQKTVLLYQRFRAGAHTGEYRHGAAPASGTDSP